MQAEFLQICQIIFHTNYSRRTIHMKREMYTYNVAYCFYDPLQLIITQLYV